MPAQSLVTTVRRLAHLARGFGVAAAVLAWTAIAAPPAGTLISNQATSTSVLGGVTRVATSNFVQATTFAAPGAATATLVEGRSITVEPGGTAFFPHVLTNLAVGADTFALSVVNLPGLFDLSSITILPDANGDGVPDSTVPLPSTVTVAAGGVFRFVVRAVTPAGAPVFTYDSLQVNAISITLGGPSLANVDNVIVQSSRGPAPDLVTVLKSFSVAQGPSPLESMGVTLRFGTTHTPAATCASSTRFRRDSPTCRVARAGAFRAAFPSPMRRVAIRRASRSTSA
ncbi:MAG: hypothetical protein IPP91_01040 [Betaproteobacteria bacterium]|nr:hypothetical protein [Betaproteobacteria bacterium]